jgi:hypothetical protein
MGVRHGIALAAVGESDEDLTLDMASNHPEMHSRPADIVARRIGRSEKFQGDILGQGGQYPRRPRGDVPPARLSGFQPFRPRRSERCVLPGDREGRAPFDQPQGELGARERRERPPAGTLAGGRSFENREKAVRAPLPAR